MTEQQADKKIVAILVYPGVSMLDLTGLYSTLNGLKMVKYDVTVVAENKQPVPTDTPLKVVPHQSIDEVPHPTILAVVGGGLPSLQVIGKPFVREYLLSSTPAADIVLGFGTGSVVLAAYGLLNQRPAATHWAFSGLLEAFGARYAGERWVEDGRFITTAGGSAAMDMGLTLLARLAGEKNARMLQLFAEYDPQPPFGGIDWSRVNHDEMAAFSPDQVQMLIQSLDRQPEIQRIVQGWAERLSSPAMITQIGRGGIA